MDPHTRIYHALLAEYGGESFYEKDTSKVFQTRGTASLKPGSTMKSVLEELVGLQLVCKVG